MNADLLFAGGIEILLLLLAVSAHESAHAWVADRCGDPTARSLGRVSLNPVRHLDLFGSLILPLLQAAFREPVFGWARPTPVVPQNLRNPYRDSLLIAAAGPVANGLLAALATIGVGIVVQGLGGEERRAAAQTVLQSLLPLLKDDISALTDFPVMFTLVRMATINAFLVVFNLLPLPPLDGGQIVVQLLPPDWGAKLAGLRPYGLIIGMILGLLLVKFLLLPFYILLSMVIQIF
ncbi:MAG TPA: site-2 protease family protein [Thermoanaerobaculia bacterium]|nr:site-2 protease family protein [Thermoanaerobaculia bacterium]